MTGHKTPNAEAGAPDFLDILRKTLLVGGGAVANMAIGLVRNKFIAVLLGPAGIALTGLLTQLVEIVGATFSLGLGTSGIRQIATCASSGDEQRLARIVKTLRRTVWITGILGAIFMVLMSKFIAQITFGEEAHIYVLSIALLAVAVLCRALYTGQGCVIQGTRRVGDYMRISVGSALLGVLASIPCYFYFGIQGVGVAVVLGYVATLIVSWWFARRVPILNVPCTIKDSRAEARLLIAFGLPVMLSGLVSTFSPYVERVILIHRLGLNAAGQYQAAFSLAGVAVTFVLAAMSADYYPKLVAHADEPKKFNDEMNAQIEVALLLSVPGLVWLAVLAQHATALLYTADFSDSGAVLRIMMIGVVGRILAAPLRLALYAKGKGKTIFALESLSALFGFMLINLFAAHLGLIGCGWAFAALHIGVGALLVFLMPKFIKQTVSPENLRIVSWSLIVLAGLWVNHTFNPATGARIAVAALLAVGASGFCLWRLARRVRLNFKTESN